jgi:[NiFe] hydrogenase diaphorase moiety small subunit
MMVPRYPYDFPLREVDASSPKIIKDQNRCILCKRCIKSIKDEDGKSYFAFRSRGNHLEVVLDAELASTMTDELAEKAMQNCPVGSILVKEKGFETPIGKRKFDHQPIGSDFHI